MQDTQKNSPEITRKRDRDCPPLVNHRDRTWYRIAKNDGIPKWISRVSCTTLVHIETPKESLNATGTRDGDLALLMNQQDWTWYSIRNKKRIPKRIFGILFRLLVHPESTKKIFQDNKEMRRRWFTSKVEFVITRAKMNGFSNWFFAHELKHEYVQNTQNIISKMTRALPKNWALLLARSANSTALISGIPNKTTKYFL